MQGNKTCIFFSSTFGPFDAHADFNNSYVTSKDALIFSGSEDASHAHKATLCVPMYARIGLYLVNTRMVFPEVTNQGFVHNLLK